MKLLILYIKSQEIHEVYQCQWIFNNTSTDCTKQYIVYYGLGHCSNKAITTMTCSY